ncbi:hypothetical protein, partial [Gluconacetobacter diazotrophicus]|uniref:hypothetical protein n=1 Tax=Gluconacetobacter diazotrophicus TaxID=33996 RepID=UPI001C7F42D4
PPMAAAGAASPGHSAPAAALVELQQTPSVRFSRDFYNLCAANPRVGGGNIWLCFAERGFLSPLIAAGLEKGFACPGTLAGTPCLLFLPSPFDPSGYGCHPEGGHAGNSAAFP